MTEINGIVMGRTCCLSGWKGEIQEIMQNYDFSLFSENDEMLAQVTSNYTSFLNHCFVCHTYDNPVLLLWVVYLHVVVI
jgi:hypothetical protein